MLSLRLVVAAGPNEGDVVPVRGAQFRIGRAEGCHFRPGDPDVPDLQCALLSRSGRFFLQNLHPAGTLLGRRQVLGEIELRDGDRLQLGEWLFRVRMSPATILQVPASQVSPTPAEEVCQTAGQEAADALPMPSHGPGTTTQMPVPITPPAMPRLASGSSPARPPSGKALPTQRTILVGLKDRAAVLLRQQEWEAMQAHKRTPAAPAPTSPPRPRSHWLALSVGMIVVVLITGLFLAKSNPSPQPGSGTPVLVENRPLPLAGPRPPRRRAMHPPQSELRPGEQQSP
jgi:predicted component of type VI protein secretion system